MSSRSLQAGIVWTMLLLLPATVLADRIILKNGYVAEGWITEETDDYVVLTVLRGTDKGTLRFVKRKIATIERGNKEDFETARARAEEERAGADTGSESTAPLGVTPSAELTPRNSGRKAPSTPGKEATDKPENELDIEKALKELKTPYALPEASEHEQKLIDALIDVLGKRRRGQRRTGAQQVSARDELAGLGLVALKPLTDALGSDNSYRRLHAADAIGLLAAKERQTGYYKDAVPALIKLQRDQAAFVRAAADKSLREIAKGLQFHHAPVFGGASGDVAAAKWTTWWKDAQVRIPPKPKSKDAGK